MAFATTSPSMNSRYGFVSSSARNSSREDRVDVVMRPSIRGGIAASRLAPARRLRMVASGGTLDVLFRDRQLLHRFEDELDANRAWGHGVARKFVQRNNQLAAARDRRELYALRSLRIHQLTGDRAGRWAIVLHGPWRLEVTFSDNEVMVEEVSNHYGD
ncbi:MAG: hypothetical protein C0506_15790 [Anaerolinea sp.]|nr:hypothetical protein [Anaerolinea sp.]